MKISILPKFIFEDEDIITLRDKGIQLQEGLQTFGDYKVPCYKFYNLNELEVIDELYKGSLLESKDDTSQKNSFAVRVVSTLFLRFRQVVNIKDTDQKIIAACALMSAVNSLAQINIQYANRFVPLLRSIV